MTDTATTKVAIPMEVFERDGNAFWLLGTFSKYARRQGWPKAEIDDVIDAAKAGSYEHLLDTLVAHIEFTDKED